MAVAAVAKIEVEGVDDTFDLALELEVEIEHSILGYASCSRVPAERGQQVAWVLLDREHRNEIHKAEVGRLCCEAG